MRNRKTKIVIAIVLGTGMTIVANFTNLYNIIQKGYNHSNFQTLVFSLLVASVCSILWMDILDVFKKEKKNE